LVVAAKAVSSKSAARGAASHIGLNDDALLDVYYKMLLTRLVGERMFILNRQGRAPFAIAGVGHEACQVGSARALKAGQDLAVPYYRDIGVALTLGMTTREIMLGFLGKAGDPCSGGRQMPNHWSKAELRIISGSSVVGTQIPHAAGIALATKLRGEKDVTMVWFGEGATSEGDFHEGLNFAGIHKLPVVFFCENNGYAISEPQWKEMAVANVADRAKAYGFEGMMVDGNDAMVVYQTTKWAVEETRRGHGPKLIEAKTYRIVPHSSEDDDSRYRSRKELQEWVRKDPIDRFKKYLAEDGVLSDEIDADLRARAAAEVDDAVEYAESRPYPELDEALRHVYLERGR
jgi:2-oxoisovalerate dehydrogenase E1 component alpha subunit